MKKIRIAQIGISRNSHGSDILNCDFMIQGFAKMVRGGKENPRSCDYELDLFKLVKEACGE